MGKVLVSWVATGHDFLNSDTNSSGFILNEEGPHFSLYQDFGDDFDIHYLLNQYEEGEDSKVDLKLKTLVGELQSRFKKKVQLKYMGIEDVLSIGLIKGRLQDFMKFQLKEMDVEVFISPGTPSMQTAWYLLGCELSNRQKITFFRRRERKFLPFGQIPPKEKVSFDVSNYAGVANIRDNLYVGTYSAYLKPHISESIEAVYSRANLLAGNNKTTVLIQGEAGTGKNFLANYIHFKSNRANKPIVKINCGAYIDQELEKVLLGYEKGAFTRATQLRTGIFEQAKGGTVVLEEIDLVPIYLQKRLNTILSCKKFRRIGAANELDLDVRIVATTTKDLWDVQNKNLFLKELYYQIAVAELKLPMFSQMSKTERKEWINYFMETTYTKLEQDYISDISKEAWDFMLSYPFLGNLKEVENLVETFYMFCKKKITYKDIPNHMIRESEESNLLLDTVIKKHVKSVVERCSGNVAQASEYLGITRNTVNKYLK